MFKNKGVTATSRSSQAQHTIRVSHSAISHSAPATVPPSPLSTPGTVFWAFKAPPAQTQGPWSAPPVPPTTPFPSGTALPGWHSPQLQSQPCCCLPALFNEQPHHPLQLALKWIPKAWPQQGSLQGLTRTEPAIVMATPATICLSPLPRLLSLLLSHTLESQNVRGWKGPLWVT